MVCLLRRLEAAFNVVSSCKALLTLANRRPAGIFLISLVMAAAGCSSSGPVPQAIPGTEDLMPGPGKAWFSISPEEHFLAYLAAYGTPDTATEDHLVTIELPTGRKTHHDLSQLVPVVHFEYNNTHPWLSADGWVAPSGWIGNTYYLDCSSCIDAHGSTVWLAFTAGIAEGVVSYQPMGAVRGSDCVGTYHTIEKKLNQHGLQAAGVYNQFSVPCRDTTMLDIVYSGENVGGDTIRLIRRDERNIKTLVFEHQHRYHSVYLDALRVSPDQRYLAYAIGEKPALPIPWPATTTVYVFDMLRKQRLRVEGGWMYFGNMMWSGDSKDLFFAGISRLRERGAFRIDVAGAEAREDRK